MKNQRTERPVESRQASGLMTTRTFLAAGIALALIIGVAAVFFASADPDGLESTALVVQGQKTLTGDTPPDAEIDEERLAGGPSYSSPLPDYTLGEGTGSPGSVIAIAGGTLLSLLAVFGVLWAMKAGSRQKEEQVKP